MGTFIISTGSSPSKFELIGNMASDKDKLLIQIKPHGTLSKPQQKTVALAETGWEIEWSTSSSVPMTIDYFNITVGRIMQGPDLARKVEECWRVTHVAGHARKVVYGVNPQDATSTPAKPISEGLYAIKIAGMSAITEGMHVETGVGAAMVKLMHGTADAAELSRQTAKLQANVHDDATPARIVNETVLRFFSLTDDDSDAES